MQQSGIIVIAAKAVAGHSGDIPLKYPGIRVTQRAANFIQNMLKCGLTVKCIAEITGIHWDTIRRIHSDIIDEALENRTQKLKEEGYRPKYLAVDEFAIHKRHSYATCVLDLEQGNILWVGKDRAKKEFQVFFVEYDLDWLSEVKAVAMDMNAPYHLLVSQYLPHATIVYDRYHMQAQFSKDVLGAVRLAEAKKHKSKAAELKEVLKSADKTKEEKAKLKKEIRTETSTYTRLKKSRWPLLKNSDNLDQKGNERLQEILNTHSDLAVCYAMKEELTDLFELTDEEEARRKWINWFEAVKTSGIEPLVSFAALKEKRINGLVAHASHPISTGKLEVLTIKKFVNGSAMDAETMIISLS